jgi:O-antigen ligase
VRSVVRSPRLFLARLLLSPPHLPALGFLCVYVCLLLLIPSSLVFRPLGAAGTPATMFGLGALLWWVGAKLAGWPATRQWSPVRTVMGVVLVCVLASYIAGSAFGWYAPSNMHQRTDDVLTLDYPTVSAVNAAMLKAADRGLLAFASWMGVVLLTVDGMRHWRDLEKLVRFLVWVATLIAAMGIFQFYTGVNLASYIHIPGLQQNSEVLRSLTRSVLVRVSATSTHPIEFGVVIAALFPLALHVAFHRTRRLDLVPAFAMGVAVPLAVSRSGVLVFVVTLIVMMVYWPSAWRRRALVVAPIAVVALRLAIPGLVGTIFSLFAGIAGDPSVTGRTSDYGVVLGLYSQHPWFGRGLFTFIPSLYRILDNQMLMVLVELGIVGFLAVTLLFVVGFLSGLGARRRCADPARGHLAMAASAGLLGIFLAYFTFDAWGFAQAAGTSFLLLGLTGAAWRLSVLDPGVPVEPPAEAAARDVRQATA